MARVQFSFYRSKSKVKLSCRRTTPAPLCHCYPSQSQDQLAATWLVTGGVATAATTTNRTTSVLSSSLSSSLDFLSLPFSALVFYICPDELQLLSSKHKLQYMYTHTHTHLNAAQTEKRDEKALRLVYRTNVCPTIECSNMTQW